MKERLFTFGCSYTRYYWPTWAEILGREYEYFENWGQPGVGNRAIIEKLTECIMNNKITENDTVIIQWSDFHRFDVHMPMPSLPEGWAQGGNMLLAEDFDKTWISSVWNEKSYIMHTLNFISLGIMVLESLPCKWYMTSIHDIKKDILTNPDKSVSIELVNYLKIFDHKNWLKPMDVFFENYDFPIKELLNDRHVTEKDLHPIPIAHYAWLNEILVPVVKKDPSEEWAIKATDILMNECTHYHLLDKEFRSNLGWRATDNWIKGVIDTDYVKENTLRSLHHCNN